MLLPRLLVVDDDALVCRALARTLAPSFRVTLASSAEGALAVIDAGAVFDAVLCDLHLPWLSGQGFYEALALRSKELAGRVVMITGDEASDDGAFTRSTGVRVLYKTGPRAALLAALAAVASPRKPLLPSTPDVAA